MDNIALIEEDQVLLFEILCHTQLKLIPLKFLSLW